MYRKLKLLAVLGVLTLLLAGCVMVGQPTGQGMAAGGLRAIEVADVQVQVGVGSPIPVDIFVSGSWPDLCAQLASMTQRIEGTQIDVTLLASEADANCPADLVGLPFRIAIPLNVVEMAEGDYTVTVNGVSATFTVPVQTPSAATGEAVLAWEGYTEMGDGDASTCKSLTLTADNQAQVGPCGGTMESVELTAYAQEWADIQARFAPFTLETETDLLTFQGMGELSGPAWERAILNWTHYTYGTLVTGRVSASAKTAMSWRLGEVEGQEGMCRHLIVLVHGYAQADVVPCDGGDVTTSTGGWLTTEEMTAFDEWLHERAPLTVDDNYLAGTGSQAMTDAETEQVAEWAEALYERLAGEE